MDLYNPYDKPEVSQEFPFILGFFFVLGILLVAAAVYIILMRDSKSPRKDKIPDWAFTMAYPTLFLLLPFVMLVFTMIFFPCWWQNCP